MDIRHRNNSFFATNFVQTWLEAVAHFWPDMMWFSTFWWRPRFQTFFDWWQRKNRTDSPFSAYCSMREIGRSFFERGLNWTLLSTEWAGRRSRGEAIYRLLIRSGKIYNNYKIWKPKNRSGSAIMTEMKGWKTVAPQQCDRFFCTKMH